ncbi:MAG: hypothetical protein ACKO96_16880, partial [Flammeovirgaceae bacterium]
EKVHEYASVGYTHVVDAEGSGGAVVPYRQMGYTIEGFHQGGDHGPAPYRVVITVSWQRVQYGGGGSHD